MNNGISGLDMVSFRIAGAVICFWITSFFTPGEKVAPRDMVLFFFAAMLAIVFNQCCFITGLSITSPVNASIATTTMPVITVLIAVLFTGETVTVKKIAGISCGLTGALILVLGNAGSASVRDGRIEGDLLCLLSQFCFACYLTIFRKLISRYSAVTCMKWMFTYALIAVIPFTYKELLSLQTGLIETRTWIECLFVAFCGTYIAYMLMMTGQKNLRPTAVSMYNYVQPVAGCFVSVIAGLGTFSLNRGIAVMLVFFGILLVTRGRGDAGSDHGENV